LRRNHGLDAYLFAGPERRVGRPGGAKPLAQVAVLVGNAQSMKEAEDLLSKVKQVRPRSLPMVAGAPRSLNRAVLTVNPITRFAGNSPASRPARGPAE
jgi:hypothetical protein